MFAFLMVLFVLLSLVLAFAVLIQQGKGDMGLGSMSGSRQMLFGGSGGQGFFEKITWIAGSLFVLGALGLAIMKARDVRKSRLDGFSQQTKNIEIPSTATKSKTTNNDDHKDIEEMNEEEVDKSE